MNPERVKNVVFIFQILTDRHLRVLGDLSGNAYAIGDCADIKDFSLPCTAQVGFSNRGSYMSRAATFTKFGKRLHKFQ